jgi:hypothetical protein
MMKSFKQFFSNLPRERDTFVSTSKAANGQNTDGRSYMWSGFLRS